MGHCRWATTCTTSPKREAWTICRNWIHGTCFLWDPRAAPTLQRLGWAQKVVRTVDVPRLDPKVVRDPSPCRYDLVVGEGTQGRQCEKGGVKTLALRRFLLLQFIAATDALWMDGRTRQSAILLLCRLRALLRPRRQAILVDPLRTQPNRVKQVL